VRQPIPFGKYLLLERISVGGMAEVFKAKAFGVEGFEKIIAIKRILPTMAEDLEFIQMFIDEAKIAGQLSHANICQIFELGKITESHFIAMEFIWGKDLLQMQNRFRKLRQTMPVPRAWITRTARKTPAAIRSPSCIATSRRRTSWSATKAK
jgi:serine/threonine protein kinase